MSYSLNLKWGIDLKGVLRYPLALSTASDPVGLGQGDWAAISETYTTGEGDSQANTWYHGLLEVESTADYYDLDLRDGQNAFGQVAFDIVKFVLFALEDQDGVKKFRVGPMGVSNGWTDGPFKGTSPYVESFTNVVLSNPFDGWYVGATSKILRIYNPSDDPIQVSFLIVGIQNAGTGT